MQTPRDFHFDWDSVKADENEQKHGVSFLRAATAFFDPRAVSIYDAGHSEDEDRWVLLGIDRVGTLLVIVHTIDIESESVARVRIISARRATRREKQQYG